VGAVAEIRPSAAAGSLSLRRWSGPRLAAALVLTLTAVTGAVAYASASRGFDAEGWVRDVSASAHLLTVADTGGTTGLHGRDVTVEITRSTHITRDGRAVALSAVRVGDELSSTGTTDGRGGYVAARISARTPPQPDGPAPSVAPMCAIYYTCTPELPPGTATGTVDVTIKNFLFSPAVSVVPVDTTVQVRNADGFAHTFSGNHFGSGSLNSGSSFTITFTQVGTYRFYCTIHPFMSGVLYVR